MVKTYKAKTDFPLHLRPGKGLKVKPWQSDAWQASEVQASTAKWLLLSVSQKIARAVKGPIKTFKAFCNFINRMSDQVIRYYSYFSNPYLELVSSQQKANNSDFFGGGMCMIK